MANKNKVKNETEVAKVEPKVEETKTEMFEKAIAEVEEVKSKAQEEYDKAFASLVIVRN